MDYVSHYTDLIYFANGGVSVCRYRLLALASDPKQVVIQVENHGGQKDILITDHIVRDGVLNRIADRDLTGVPFDMLCVALTEAGQHHVVFVEADLEDYIHRGYPYERSTQPAAPWPTYRTHLDQFPRPGGRPRPTADRACDSYARSRRPSGHPRPADVPVNRQYADE
ncbi:hypothetical protein [Burkholderia cenocepacia]|uniref:hypothetical protein n=1 Tax=Burkholderia cenocepacia TaxID=95486 RepID=UPI001E56D4AB|nr:hypothetical protein [Burkholderia cenocepacia]